MFKFGCPENFITEPFPVTNGVKQGSVLAPTLFSTLFSGMLTDAFRDLNIGIEFRSRTDGGSYKPQSLRTQSKGMLRDLLFADDCALCASTDGDMQWMVDLFAEACANFGLTISIKKT